MRTPPDMSLWKGRDDTATEGPEALRLHQCIKPWTEDAPPGVCLLGFACDEGVRRNQGRIGAAEGPKAIRQALANLFWRDWDPVFDAGDVGCPDGELERAQESLAERTAALIMKGQRVVTIGGGHETAWGSFLGLSQARPETSIGVINFDAHFDLRSGPATSGTPFRQMADWHQERGRPFKYLCLGVEPSANVVNLVWKADELGVKYEWNDSFERKGGRLDELLDAFVDDVDAVYLSIDLDVLPGWVMPAVSAPAGRGVSPTSLQEAVDLLFLSRGRKVLLADVVEFNPKYDPQRTAVKVAAQIVWNLMIKFSIDNTLEELRATKP